MLTVVDRSKSRSTDQTISQPLLLLMLMTPATQLTVQLTKREAKAEIGNCVCVCTGRHYHSKCITSSSNSQYLNLLSSTVRVFYGQRQPTAAAPLYEFKTKTYYYLLCQSCQSKLLIYTELVLCSSKNAAKFRCLSRLRA